MTRADNGRGAVPSARAEATYHESLVPAHWSHYVALNAEGALAHPGITEKKRG